MPPEIRVWITNLDRTESQKHLHLLSSDERQRAGRFRFDVHRNRFIAARGTLRVLLGNELKRDPSAIEFQYGKNGKPFVAAQSAQFNVSHSHGVAAFALSRGIELGIDVERIDSRPLQEGVAERFFSPNEVKVLRSLPEELQPLAFFNCWTRKESYIKATGEGISIGLDQFDVSLTPGEPAQLLSVRRDPEETQRWTMLDLDAPSGFAGALCARNCGWILRYEELQ